jgi:two-component system sensor histidine kinase KdpD
MLGGGVLPRFQYPDSARLPVTAAFLATITVACYTLHASFAVTAFLYFAVVVLYSLAGDLRSAIIVSITAGGCLDFFFLEPVFSFRVLRLVDVLALATFLGSAVTISYLATRVQQESLAAASQRDHVEQLYVLAHQLLAQDPETTPRDRAFGLFLDAFQMKAICLYDSGGPELYPAGVSASALEKATLDAHLSGRDHDDDRTGIAVRRLRDSQGHSGTIGFEGLASARLIASPLAALASLMLERARAFRHATRAAAMAETEVLRTAILDALAHEFKTPLSTILTAVGGIQESGPLQPAQLDLAQVVESEASRLGALATRLLRLARIDRENVQPRLSEIDLEELVVNVMKQYSKIWPQRRYTLVTHGEIENVSGDSELLRLAISQLLDNASKYSSPQSVIEVEVERRASMVAVSVWNSGPPVPAEERERIFERFYRGTNAREVPGSGLGLYVARRIAAAHGGRLSMEPSSDTRAASVFRLSFPAVQGAEKELARAQLVH